MTFFTLLTHLLAFLAGCGFIVGLSLLFFAKGNADAVEIDTIRRRRAPTRTAKA